jgi:hypothetical protein
MVTYILIALAVAAVALLAGFTGGLPSPAPRPIENNGMTPEPELESQAADADDVVNIRLENLPSRQDHQSDGVRHGGAGRSPWGGDIPADHVWR